MKNNNQINCLILGGSYFIGKTFLQMLIDKKINLFTLYVANRGTKDLLSDPFIHYLKIDRNDVKSCEILANYHFDIVIDFSCWSLAMLKNVTFYLNNPYYVFISSGCAEIEDTNHADYDYGNQKKICEDYLKKHLSRLLIIRPGYVMGENDYTDRFYKDSDIDLYFHKNTRDIAMPYIDVNTLTSSILNLINHQETGLVTMGYVPV